MAPLCMNEIAVLDGEGMGRFAIVKEQGLHRYLPCTYLICVELTSLAFLLSSARIRGSVEFQTLC